MAEEMLFRGILYQWCKRIGFPRLGLWCTSLIFAAMHSNLASFIPLLVLAVTLVILYERTENLIAPIAAHSTFNAINFTLLYLQQPPITQQPY
jgi:membrane protease YdiL (CAAX protease family)